METHLNLWFDKVLIKEQWQQYNMTQDGFSWPEGKN